jgi:hypothetical protein
MSNYKVAGRALRYNGKRYEKGDSVTMPASEGDVFADRGRLKKTAAKAPAKAATTSSGASSADKASS